jgi:hypothetical protein
MVRIGRWVAAVIVISACGSKHDDPPLHDYIKTQTPKIEALRQNVPRATAAATAPEAASAPADCGPLHLKLNGKKAAGNAEILWSDEAADILAGKLPSATSDPHLVQRFSVAGWCQLLSTSMYWLDPTTKGAKELEKSGVSAKIAGWIESALNLTYVIVLVPGTAARGEQKVALRAVELATGTVKCQVEVTGHADPSLGVEYYQLYRKSTGQQVGGVQSVDKYSSAMRDDLVLQIGEGLRKAMGVDLHGYCHSASD